MHLLGSETRYRAIWISDVHIGTKACKADLLLDFLQRTRSDHLYLVGDIVDGWNLRKSWFWTDTYNQLLLNLLEKARNGTRVVYIPGNHDEALRDYCGTRIGGVAVEEHAIHVTADGRRLLITHGDEFDGVVKYARWLAFLGDAAYRFSLTCNHWFNVVRRKLGYPYWSLSAHLKHTVKNAVEFVGNFEQALADEARRHAVDGIVCGHIHHAQIRDIGGMLYCNDGDWVESCTALVEHFDGRLEILHWGEIVAQPDELSLVA